MSELYLRVLGKPELILKGERIERLRTWRLWGVLAYVALSAEPVPRAVLAHTFWSEFDNPRASLKVALRDLRVRAGRDIFREQNECLSLVPGLYCDVLELREYTRQARERADLQQKRCYLDAAASLARDEFLAGYEGDWVLQQRGALFLECRALFRELLALKLALGQPAESVEVARELLRYDPENTAAVHLLLHYDKPDSIKERATARQLIQARLRRWKEPRRTLLFALATFPGPFRAAQARGLTGLTDLELGSAVESELLQECPRGFVLPQNIRQDFWHRLTGGERRRFRRRFASGCIAELISRSPVARTYPALQGSGAATPDDDLSAYLQREKDNLTETLEICLQEPEVENALLFLCVVWEVCPEWRNGLIRYEELIQRGVPETLPDGVKHYVYATIAMMSVADTRLEPFFHAYLDRYALEATGGHWPRTNRFEAVLKFFHHQGDDARFDEILLRRIQLLRDCPQEPLGPYIHHIIAENSMARRRFAHALLHNEPCLAHWREHGTPDLVGLACLQRGIILRGIGRNEEARALWNEALELFERLENLHGTGTCLLKLADLHRESGALSEALILIQQSIACFTTSGEVASGHAAEGILGDIYRERGQWDKARPLYQKGLDFWRARNHHRWTTIFQQRLDSVTR